MRQRGFSLTEMLVVTAVLGMLILAVGPLVEQSAKVAEATGAAARAGGLPELGRLLRADLARGRPVAAAPEGELEVALPDGSSARWALDGGVLRRELRGAAGAAPGRPYSLPGVAAWSWREVAPGLVEVRLAWTPPRPGPPRAVPQTPGGGRQGQELAVWRVARRGGEEGRSW